MTTITIERELLEQALDVLITRGAQPGYETERAWLKIVKSLEATLAAPATAPDELERKPMTDDETLALFNRVKVRMLFTDAEVAPFASGVAAAEYFHGIKENKS